LLAKRRVGLVILEARFYVASCQHEPYFFLSKRVPL
jgi:hypothetical protein